jgi:hypothetical protein
VVIFCTASKLFLQVLISMKKKNYSRNYIKDRRMEKCKNQDSVMVRYMLHQDLKQSARLR